MSPKLAGCAAAMALLVGPHATAADACKYKPTRNVIRFYAFDGVASAEGAEEFSQFRGAIEYELSHLNSTLATAPAAHPPITTEPSSADGSARAAGHLSPDVSAQLMSTDLSLLELLDGYLQIQPNKPAIVHSQIYVLGDRRKPALAPIAQDFSLSPSAHDAARSVHLAALYYALAVDAGLSSCLPEQNRFLSKASETLQDVRTAGPAVKALRDLIDAGKQEIGVPL